jgi:hypothetical protein
MPKALAGEMLTDPVVLIDRAQHLSFNRRVKATAPNRQASGAPLRSILPQAAAIRDEERDSGAIAALMLTRPMILGFIAEWREAAQAAPWAGGRKLCERVSFAARRRRWP